MPKLNTQPVSDAHDEIFSSVVSGLDRVQDQLADWAGQNGARIASVPVVKDYLTPSGVNKGFRQLRTGLTKQHDFVEGLLAKTR